MYKFERILKDNQIAEDSSDLPQAIKTQIKKFRNLEKMISDNPDDVAGNEEREGQLSEIDTKIMLTLPDHFDMEDEAEELAKQKEKARIEAENDAKVKQKQKDKEKADQLAEALKVRAKAVKLPASSTEAEISAAEKAISEESELTKNNLRTRAKKVNLSDDATESDIDNAEKAEKTKQAETEELKKPAKSNAGALENLFKLNHKTVTVAQLKAAGFNTGWLGPIGMHGCTCGNYRIYREAINSNTFQLLKN